MRYHNITKDDMLNGAGLRVVLWLAGCGHACPGCHNAVTWDAGGGIEFDNNAKNEIFDELGRDYISGLTLSGGDPLFPASREAVGWLVKEVKEKFPDKTIWLYTGYSWEDISDIDFIGQIDVLVDGRFEKELADINYHWAGSSNQRVIDVGKTLETGSVVIYEA